MLRHRGLGGHGGLLPRVGWSRLPQDLLGSLGSRGCLCDRSKCGEGEREGPCLKTTLNTRQYSGLHLLPHLSPSEGEAFCSAPPKWCLTATKSSPSGLRLWGLPGLRDMDGQSCSAASGRLSFPSSSSLGARHLLRMGFRCPAGLAASSLLHGSQGAQPEEAACRCQ